MPGHKVGVWYLFDKLIQIWRWSTFHDFTFSGVLSLSARASDERAQAILINVSRWVPRLSGCVRAPLKQWRRIHFPPRSLCINNNHSWGAITCLEANHSDLAFQSRVFPLRSQFCSVRKSQSHLACSNTIWLVTESPVIFLTNFPGDALFLLQTLKTISALPHPI